MGVSAGLTLLYVVGRHFGQHTVGGVHRRLHVLGSGVDVAVQVELQRDAGVPKELIEVISARPLIWPNCRSSGVVTEDTITSGAAPG